MRSLPKVQHIDFLGSKTLYMDIQLVYIGADQSFSSALAESAEFLKISFQLIPPDQNADFSPQSDMIILIDQLSSGDSPWLSSLNSASPLPIYIHAVSDWHDQPHQHDIPPLFHDTLTKNIPQEFLVRKIEFYLNYLQTLSQPGLNEKIHELNKKNHRLNTQLANLQEKITQIGSDLHIQEKVIEKINQISHLSKQINCLDIKKISSVCIEQIPKLIAANYASLYAYDHHKGVLQLLQHNHPYTIARVVILANHPKSPMTLAVEQKRLLLIKDFSQWEQEEETSVKRLFARNYNTTSCIIAPLLSGDKILGVLNLADKIDSPAFDRSSDLPPVQLLCEIIGSAMSNIELYEEVQKRAQTDSMTNLLNHRSFYDALDREIHRAQRYNSNLSLLMMDLDSLKIINDSHGHRAGDAVLMHVADKILACIRDTDIAARYGGDEFAIILPNTSLSDAMHVAERMADMISHEPVDIDGHQLTASVSVGLGQYRSEQSIEDFMNETDGAMFDAKTAGKNRVHVCGA